MNYLRAYADKPCVQCGTMITAPKGPQRFCEPCKTTCSVDGCKNPVRAKGLCKTHSVAKHKVPVLISVDGRCGVDACERDAKHNGVCGLHYNRFYSTGAFGDAAPMEKFATNAPCRVEGCDKPARGKGYCATHYARYRTKGDAGQAGLMYAPQGSGSITQTGYRKIKLEDGYEFEHRHVMSKKLGRALRKGENVHHIDGDRLNNDPSNLELWKVQQPAGQRLEDKLTAAAALLTKYGINHEVFNQSSAVDGLMSFGM